MTIKHAIPAHHSHMFLFGGETFVSADTAALWWPREEALIVADLHLEKGSWFAARGQMLPPYDSNATIKHLSDLAEKWQARAIYCLGDNFHDDAGPSRLSDTALMALANLSSRLQIHWIVGNHDENMSAPIGEDVHQELLIHGLYLRHIAEDFETSPEISGHYHPKLRMQAQRRPISRPCFVMDERKLILPAFGSYAGGLDIYDEAISSQFSSQMIALVHTEERLCQFPVAVREVGFMASKTVA